MAISIALPLVVLAAPLMSHAQPQAKLPRIGLLMGGSPASTAPLAEAFQRGLRELGYVERQHVAFEYRYAEGRAERLPDLAAELVRLKVNAIVVGAAPAIRAVKVATSTIPVVMAAVTDPLEAELVTSLARPGGNITGVSALAEGYSAKWLELLKETAPKATRIAVLVNPSNPSHTRYWRETQAAARVLGVTVQPHEVRDPNELAGAFAAMAKERFGSLLVLPDPMFLVRRDQIVELSAKSRLPTMYGLREFAEAGGLMAYGSDLREIYRHAAGFVAKILKGAKPGDLPVEQATRVELVINLKTAKALGLTIPQSILVRADQVLQ